MPVTETFRTLYCDPGEDTGWCIGRGTKLLAAGTEKMWPFIDDVAAAIENPDDPDISILNGPLYARKDVAEDENLGPIERIVMEDWRLYPWAMKGLAFDRCRTARAIGALTYIGRRNLIPCIFQPAAIKPAAEAAGAHELYYRPLRENRHQNDAIQHFVYYTQTELVGVKLPIPAENAEERVD